MLELGFHGFEAKVLFAEGQTIGAAKVFGGDASYVPLVGARHRPGDVAAQRQRAADRAHRLYRSGAGADQPKASRSAS